MSDLTMVFINGLSYLLQYNYEPAKIARYAYEFYLDNDIEDERLEYVVNFLKGMDAGPEFELTESELMSFIKDNLN